MNEETKQFIQSELKQFRNDLAEIITAGFDNVDRRFEDVDKRFDGADRRFEGIDKRFDGIDKRFDTLEKDLNDFKIETGANFIHIQRDINDLRNHLAPLGEPLEVMDMLARLKYVEQKLGIESGK